MYDIIGDIHGYADTLLELLNILGYDNKRGYFSHPNRKIIFLGDFIDRGPQIRKTLKIVRPMIEIGSAYCVMGNHEYNAICYHTKDSNGNYLREHTEKNIRQHKQTLLDFKEYKDEFFSYLDWFRTIPLFLELKGIRIVHACWDFDYIDFLKNKVADYKLTDKLLFESSNKGSTAYNALEIVLKGKEMTLPKDHYFYDKDGIQRKAIRIKWWIPFNHETYRSIAVNNEEIIPDIEIPKEKLSYHKPYLDKEPPVFIGHYWKRGEPEILSKNACCLDYSVAKGGYLVAYRWDGETELNNNKFVKVKSKN